MQKGAHSFLSLFLFGHRARGKRERIAGLSRRAKGEKRMTQESKKPNLGEQAGQRRTADSRPNYGLNVAEKETAVKRFCPLRDPGFCSDYCAWWIEGKCVVVRVVEVLAAQ